MADRPSWSTVVAAAEAFGVEVGVLVAIGGHSGETWGAGEHVLRVKATVDLDRELAACAATSGVVPTAEVVDRVDLDGTSEPCWFFAVCGASPPLTSATSARPRRDGEVRPAAGCTRR